MTTDTIISRPLFWLVAILTILLSLSLSIIDLSEWFIVGIQKDFSSYPFNGEGPVPYYYKTPNLYSTVCFIWGLIFLTLFLFVSWALIRKNYRLTLILAGLTVFALTIHFIHGLIGVN